MLTDTELLQSSTVANATMNRGRGLSGVNSYARELRFDIGAFLEQRVRDWGRAFWYDACCGGGRALVEAGEQFRASGWGEHVQVVGADLVDTFVTNDCPNVTLLAADVVAFTPKGAVDLVTCVHGLHYLGDKLAFLERSYNSLAPGGLLLAHLDTANLREAGTDAPLWPSRARRVRAAGIRLSLKSHLLRAEKGGSDLDFAADYRGATVSTGPNYTGIIVIDSWYSHCE